MKRSRIGFGYDLHRMEEGRELYLGGIRIEFPKGLAGHSDGDCLIHAMIDALIGAAGGGDIGQMFPNTDPAYLGIRSTELLKSAMLSLKKQGLEIESLDSVVVIEKPSLAPHIPAMKKALCPLLEICEDRLGIKAKTNEGVGAVGLGEAVAAWAVVLLSPLPDKGDVPRGSSLSG